MQRSQFGSNAQVGRRVLFFVSIIAALLVLLDLASGGKLSALVRDVVSPIENGGFGAMNGISHSGFFSSRGELEAQITALQNEVQQEQLQAAAYAALEQQNQSLSQLEHLAQTSPGLTAPVISSIISSPYGTFTIGAGSADGVTQGGLVLTADGFVIGRIAQVQAHQSLVDEIFAPGAQTPVTIDGSSVLATGSGGAAQAEVPHGVTVSQNDIAVAPEFGGRPVGVVAHVDSNPANAEQAVEIALPVSLSSLQYVYVTP